jgi:uncharacterized protein
LWQIIVKVDVMNMDHLYLKSSKINGKGLHTNKYIKHGEKIGIIHGEIELIKKWTPYLSKISPNWIGIGRYTWINTKNSPFRYINHSCEPNSIIVGKRTVVAIKDIPANSEVTMDYSFTESDSGWYIPNCGCGSKNCRKRIGSIDTLPHSLFLKNKKFIPINFQKIYEINKRKSTPLYNK